MNTSKTTKTLAFVFVVLVFLVIAGSWVVASRLVRPAPATIPDNALDVPHESVSFPSTSGTEIRGWFVPGTKGHAGVILMHGVRANRLSMVSRARFLNQRGLSVLLFDFQAHGESTGLVITFGHREALDARAAVQFMRTRLPDEPLGVIGVSLGGAATLLGDEPLPVQAAVLEAVYPDIETATANRLVIRFGPFGRLLAPLLVFQLPKRLGIAVDELAPINAIRRANYPIFLVAGGKDRHTTIKDSQSLYEAAPETKRLWIIPGAAHVDFHRYAGIEYESRILTFLSDHSIR